VIPRPTIVRAGGLSLLAACSSFAGAQVVINEVHYAPEPKTAKLEFIELLNSGPAAVDLGGWRVSGGVDCTFPAGTVLGAGKYLLVCQDLGALTAAWYPPLSQETAVVYDYSTATGSPTPGTAMAGQDRWILPGGGSELTVRSDVELPGISGNRGYSSATAADATRCNDAAFSYAIPAGATTLRFSLTGRIKNSATASLGPGCDANGNQRISTADATGEYGFEFGFTNNTWFIRQAAQGPQTSSANLGFNASGRVWYMELRVDPAANGGDGAGSLFVRQLGDTSNNPVADTLKPVANLQNIPLGLSRMSANGGHSNPAAWNGLVTRIGAGHLDAITVAHASLQAPPETPLMFQMNGALSNEGETLNLRNASDTVVDTVGYRAEFPWPVSAAGGGPSMQLIHPDLDNDLGGSWRAALPTPAAQNAVHAGNAPPQVRQVAHFPQVPAASQPIVVSAKATDPHGVAQMKLFYQIVAPGDYLPAFLPHPHATLLATPNAPLAANPAFEDPANWTEVVMRDNGGGGDLLAGDDIFTASIPGQLNRALVRYRVRATDLLGSAVQVPYADDPSLNFACFVYNGVPDWRAATRSVHPEGAGHVYPSSLLNSLPVHTLITRNADLLHCYAYSSLGNSGWQIPKSNTEARSAFNWEAAFVSDGIVYDHIRYRLRQSNDRYSGNGKRSMRFRFNDGHHYQALDENGEKLPAKWRKLNTAKMSRFGGATEYGLREVINSRLWKLFGVEVPAYWHAHFRVIDGPDEAPAGTNGQHLGDFHGLALFYEDFAGAFLENRGLAKGNVYKWKDGVTNPADLQQYQAREAVADYSDFTTIHTQLRPERDEAWLRSHVDWNQWYRYHAICEAIRHYDFGVTSGHWKNRGWYFQPAPGSPRGLLRHIPHDHDATWYVGYHDGLTVGIGVDFAKQAIFGANGTTEKYAFTVEYRNVLRECRDLLWQPETVHDMIDRTVAGIAAFTLADRDRWLSAPAAAGYESGMPAIETLPPGLKSFAFVADTVNGSTLVGGRAAYLDQLAHDPAIPATPVISYAGSPGYPVNGVVLESSAYQANSAASFAAIQWRLGEVTDPASPAHDPAALPVYEITPAWDSGELSPAQLQAEVPLFNLRSGHSYRARVRHRDSAGRWSHWSAPLAFTATSADLGFYQSSVVVSEFMYHPAGANENLEYVELLNISRHEVDLTPLRFTKGIDFDFAGSDVTTLAPGGRVLVVKNRAAFEAAHGSGHPIAGETPDNLSNGGERLKLSYGAGDGIVDFIYDDLPPWPLAADGGGPSLVLADPLSAPDHGIAANWRVSTTPGGTPGSTDAPVFTGDPAADLDGDGIPALLEFALGGSDSHSGDRDRLPRLEWWTSGGLSFPALAFSRPHGIEGIYYILQTSGDLFTWSDHDPVNHAAGPPPAGGEVPQLYRSPAAGATPRQFLRLKVEPASP
jgi:hypothetical protein